MFVTSDWPSKNTQSSHLGHPALVATGEVSGDADLCGCHIPGGPFLVDQVTCFSILNLPKRFISKLKQVLLGQDLPPKRFLISKIGK